MIKNALEKTRLKERLIIQLENSSMPADARLNNKKYWLDVEIY